MTHPSTGNAWGILHVLLKVDIEKVKSRLVALRAFAWSPMLLPLIILETRTEHVVERLTPVRDQVYDTEKLIGSHKNYQKSAKHVKWGYYERGETVWARKGFDGSAGVLTSLAADAAFFESQCSAGLNFLFWIEEMHKASPLTCDLKPDLNSKIRFMRSGLENSRIRCGYLGRRAEIAVQQVSASRSELATWP